MIEGIELRVMVRRQRTTSGGVWPGSLGGGRLARYEANQKRSKTSIGEYCFSNRRLKPEAQMEYKVRNKDGRERGSAMI